MHPNHLLTRDELLSVLREIDEKIKDYSYHGARNLLAELLAAVEANPVVEATPSDAISDAKLSLAYGRDGDRAHLAIDFDPKQLYECQLVTDIARALNHIYGHAQVEASFEVR